MDNAAAQEVQRWRRRAEREREARIEAETIAEKATLDLYATNTELDAQNQRLAQASETLYRELFARNPLPMYVVDRHNLQFLEVNETAQTHYGFTRAEFLDMTLRDIDADAAIRDGDVCGADLEAARYGSSLHHHVTRDRRSIEVELSIHSLQWHDRSALLVVARDVTEQHRDRRALELRNQAIEASRNGVFICSATDTDFPILYLNAAMERFGGQSRTRLLGQPFTDLFAVHNAGDAARMVSALQDGRSAQSVIAAHSNESEALWLEIQITPVPDDSGVTQHWIGIVQDITERKAFEATLVHRAHHDGLTGLPNRELLRQRLNFAIKTAERVGIEVGVLFLDFDKFKQINDIGGHSAGDYYLKTLARRLGERVRSGDTLARVGGDEFVVVTTGENLSDFLPELALRVQDAFAEPVVISEQSFSARCSIGIARYPTHGHDAETLLRRADLTMYTAKRDGGHGIEWFSASVEANFRKQAEIETALQRALDHEEFELHYQPQIDMRDGAVVGLEALLRWPGAASSFRGPADFIPVAEESGLIGAIGAWVLEQACADLARLRKDNDRALTMAVNVSAMQLRESDFAETVAALLESNNLPPDALEIEITESVLMAEYDKALSTLHTLKSMGVRLAIDDFGTGYSSLSYLRRLPVHRLKIDRSFINEMEQSALAGELVRNVASMAKNLEIEPLAEGVETESEVKTLLGYGCFLAQGYHFSHPLPMAQLGARLATMRMPTA